MAVASMVLEISDGASDTVLASLGRLQQVSVYGIKEDRIVVVVEGDSVQSLEESLKMLAAIDQVTAVYPVFTATYA
jgi:nitrate reductase NapAB chaperone NapD